MSARGDRAPAERTETVRQAIRSLLQKGAWTAHDISEQIGVSERNVESELESVARGRQRLVIRPAACIGCGFLFEDRRRVKKPGRCPKCRSERIDPPQFSMAAPK